MIKNQLVLCVINFQNVKDHNLKKNFWNIDFVFNF